MVFVHVRNGRGERNASRLEGECNPADKLPFSGSKKWFLQSFNSHVKTHIHSASAFAAGRKMMKRNKISFAAFCLLPPQSVDVYLSLSLFGLFLRNLQKIEKSWSESIRFEFSGNSERISCSSLACGDFCSTVCISRCALLHWCHTELPLNSNRMLSRSFLSKVSLLFLLLVGLYVHYLLTKCSITIFTNRNGK